MNIVRALVSLMLSASIVAKTTKEPETIKPFNLSYEDVSMLTLDNLKGSVLVQFVVDEDGRVIQPKILDTFNIKLNPTIIDKVMAIEFKPALQNGIPIKVKYHLPILFK